MQEMRHALRSAAQPVVVAPAPIPSQPIPITQPPRQPVDPTPQATSWLMPALMSGFVLAAFLLFVGISMFDQ